METQLLLRCKTHCARLTAAPEEHLGIQPPRHPLPHQLGGRSRQDGGLRERGPVAQRRQHVATLLLTRQTAATSTAGTAGRQLHGMYVRVGPSDDGHGILLFWPVPFSTPPTHFWTRKKGDTGLVQPLHCYPSSLSYSQYKRWMKSFDLVAKLETLASPPPKSPDWSGSKFVARSLWVLHGPRWGGKKSLFSSAGRKWKGAYK